MRAAGGGKDDGVLTGEAVEAVEGADSTLLHPAGRGSGGMKPAARATGETAEGPCGVRAAIRLIIRGPGAGRRLRKIHRGETDERVGWGGGGRGGGGGIGRAGWRLTGELGEGE